MKVVAEIGLLVLALFALADLETAPATRRPGYAVVFVAAIAGIVVVAVAR